MVSLGTIMASGGVLSNLLMCYNGSFLGGSGRNSLSSDSQLREDGNTVIFTTWQKMKINTIKESYK